MKPIIVNSYPINGSENISLDSNIVITFGAEIQKPSKENILIQNLNKNELCNFELSLSDDSKILTLIVSDPNAIGSNKLCGLTKYSIELNGIRGTTPEKVNLFLSFYTTSETREDIELRENEFTTISNDLYIIETTPTNGAKFFDGSYLKVIFSDEPYESTINSDNIYLIEGTEKTIEESYLFDIVLDKIDCDLILKNKILLIKPKEGFESNKDYTLIIDNVCNERTTINDYYLSFSSALSPLYCNYKDITNNSYFSLLSENIPNIQEDVINRIYQYSINVENIARDADTINEIDWETPSTCVNEYVLNRTLYDYVFNRYVTCVSSSRDKKLADLEISYQDKAGELLNLLNSLKNKWQQAEDDVKHFNDDSTNTIGLFVKGSDVDEERSFMDRSFRDSNQYKSWTN